MNRRRKTAEPAIATAPPAPAELDAVQDELAVPFATPARQPDGQYVLLEGELVLRDGGVQCPQCDQHTGVTVRNFRSSKPAARYDMQAAWDAARRRIVQWINTQKRRKP